MSTIIAGQACCAPIDEVVSTTDPVIALAGAPNGGKSTLFNALTGARAAVGNWPGTSTEYSRGTWRLSKLTGNPDSPRATLVDLPGSYSLNPISADEQLTADLLLAEKTPDLVIVVADAAHLARSLYLVAQLRERPIRLVVALTMCDIAKNHGVQIDPVALQHELGVPVVTIDPRYKTGLAGLATATQETLLLPEPIPRELPSVQDLTPDQCDLTLEDERFAWIDKAVSLATSNTGARRADLGDKIDRWVTGPITGPILFLGVMWAVFQLTITAAAPLQDWLDGFFSDTFSGWVVAALDAIGWSGTWVEGFVVDGLIAGVGSLMTFVPLMAIMFILLALLEDSGYLARAAVVTDRLMRRLGLPGQAFLPIVVGFGCNVPAISATRILPQANQRLLMSLLIPFTSCTARLTVYLLLGTIFFDRWAGTAVFAMYVLSIVLVVLVGLLLKKTLWRTMGDTPLVLDLPPYHRPTFAVTAATAWHRLAGFLKTASGIIVLMVTLVWFLQSMPAIGSGDSFGEVHVDDSLYAVVNQAIAPIFNLAGFGAWQLVSALIVGFVAKEAVISTWAQTFAVIDPSEGDISGFATSVMDAFNNASGGHPLAAVIAFMVFLLAYTPCVATLAAQAREIGWKWTAFGVLMQLVIAWVLAVLVFQIGCLL